MKIIAAFVFLLVASSGYTQRYEANWSSLDQRKIPAWFHQDKFGIFIHWGVYAVPAYAPVVPNSGLSYSEWYWRRIADGEKQFKEFHDKNFGKDFLYTDFEKQFKAELFDPKYWAEVFKRSGARYVVLTSKHHEGYALWNSAEADKSWGRPWNAVTGTPKRDLLGDLTNAVKDAGLKMGFYYSLYEWYNPLWRIDRNRYVTEHMIPQFKDLVTHYKPSVIFSDGEWDMSDTAWRSEELLAWLYNESPVAKEVVVNDRWGKNTRGKNTNSMYATSEYGAGMDPNIVWEESRGIGHSYGYNRNEKLDDYKTGRELILILVDVVARGGNLLLDIGPTADGRIPVIMQQRLIQIGDWLKINGEAIYSSSAWRQTYQWSEGKQPEKKGQNYMAAYDISELIKPKSGQANIQYFFTRNGKNLYCIVPSWQPQVRIKNFTAATGTSVQMLGNTKRLSGRQTGTDYVVDLSSLKPTDMGSEVFVLKLSNAL